jgi:hypothetical protein
MLNCAKILRHMSFEFTRIKQAGFMLSMNMMREIHVRFSRSATEPKNIIIPQFLGLNPCLNSPAISKLNRALASLTQWCEAFEPLYRKSRSPQVQNLFESSTVLRIHRPSCITWVASGYPSVDLYYRRYMKELREILTLTKIMMDLFT